MTEGHITAGQRARRRAAELTGSAASLRADAAALRLARPNRPWLARPLPALARLLEYHAHQVAASYTDHGARRRARTRLTAAVVLYLAGCAYRLVQTIWYPYLPLADVPWSLAVVCLAAACAARGYAAGWTARELEATASVRELEAAASIRERAAAG